MKVIIEYDPIDDRKRMMEAVFSDRLVSALSDADNILRGVEKHGADAETQIRAAREVIGEALDMVER